MQQKRTAHEPSSYSQITPRYSTFTCISFSLLLLLVSDHKCAPESKL